MRTTILPTLTLTMLAGTVSSAWCASGDPDPSFGDNGRAIATFGGSFAGVRTVVRQADGKLVAAGASADSFAKPTAIAIARFDANGTLDATFDGDGMVTTKIGAFNDSSVQVVLQSDGKIVVVGASETASDGSTVDIVILRYSTDGALDASFGTGGVVVTSLGPDEETPYAAAIQSDDKVVVTGSSRDTTNATVDLFAARFDTSGAADASFGSAGLVTLDFGGRRDTGRALAVEADDDIVIAGTSFTGPLFLDGAVGTLTRLDGSGAPDATFGNAGSVVEAASGTTFFNSVAVEGNGDIIVFGANAPSAGSFRLYRYDSAGLADSGFVGGPSPLFMSPITPQQLALGPGGEFAVTGDGFSVVRIAADGGLDPGFGTGGFSSLGIGSSAVAVLIEPDSKIILAGSARDYSAYAAYRAVVARVLATSPSCTTDSECGACERCEVSTNLCAVGSRGGCVAASAHGAKIALRSRSYVGKSRLKLKWAGAVPAIDPSASDDVSLCLFQAGKRVLKAVTPAGGTCGTTSCWSGDATSGFFYYDAEKTPDGVQKMTVTSDAIIVGAAGPQLDATAQGVPNASSLGPFSPPVLLQIQTGTSACVEATFDTQRKAKGGALVARSD